MPRTATLTASALIIAMLAACGKSEPAAEQTPKVAAVPAAPAPISTTADGSARLPAPGLYDVDSAEGEHLAQVTIGADNSYSQQRPEGLTEAGIVKLDEGKVCFDPSGKDRPTRCYTGGVPTGDGGFATFDEKGAKEIIRPTKKPVEH